ncbi:MAG: three-Cys-motif partner protein TcmP [Candidatus Muirbacterium halophilum]|nr:three-Cys-motif partner protein TcmP [Candidatus Muirbacterium halophilum]MCK9476737.1 three-Cys-motif partner protein TcmP [Candidatus Muirbacterium halophilum]
MNLNDFSEKVCKECKGENKKRIFRSENGLCQKFISKIDNLPLRCVGDWAEDKNYYLERYFSIFSNSMKNKWSKLNYIEICSGPGKSIYRKNLTESEGTAIRMLSNENIKFIKKAIFIDYDEEVVSILNKRIKNLDLQNKAKAVVCDFNDFEKINKILIENDVIGGLKFVFIDPTDCGTKFELIKYLKQKLEKVDFLLNVPYGTDLNRNLLETLKHDNYKSRKKYCDFIGEPDFFDKEDVKEFMTINNDKNSRLTEKYINYLKKNLDNIGLPYYDDSVAVKHYYKLFFITGNEIGLNFWKKISKKGPDGQQKLF